MTISTLIDSNVLIDVLEGDVAGHAWSASMLREAADIGRALVNQIVLAEVSIGFERPEELTRLLGPVLLARESLPWEAALRAGMAHALYRRRGGSRERILPDFLIGAHAVTRKHRLLTRDPARYRAYFPDLVVISPDSHP